MPRKRIEEASNNEEALFNMTVLLDSMAEAGTKDRRKGSFGKLELNET